jgi:hypothetical protein
MTESESERDDGADPRKWSKEKVREMAHGRKVWQTGIYYASGEPPDLEFQRILDEIEDEERIKGKKKKNKKQEQTSITETRTTTIETAEGVVSKEEVVRIDRGQIRYATTINVRNGVDQYIPVKEDTGTDVNWISKGLAESLALEILNAPAGIRFKDFSGHEFEATHRVTLPLVGEIDKSQHTECYIAPDGFPLDCVLVGSAFVNEVGPAHSVFAEKPKGTAFVMVQAAVTVSESMKKCVHA